MADGWRPCLRRHRQRVDPISRAQNLGPLVFVANLALLSPIPIITIWLALWVWRSIDRRAEFLPFLGTLALFTMGYVGFAMRLWPNIVPHSVSLWDAAAAPRSQAFLLVGTLFLLPVIVGYTAWSYWVFRGKVRAGAGYHYDAVMGPAARAPADVLNDPDRSLNEKRAILASWASDACAIEAAPALRQSPTGRVVEFDEIMDALRLLDQQAQASPACRTALGGI